MRLIPVICLAALATAPSAEAADTPAGPEGRTITVRVGPFRNDKGALQCTLFAEGRGFPDKPEEALATRRAPIAADLTAVCKFEGLAPGEYAVGVMHDENGNGKFDQGLFGIPLEGYGFSNNRTHALRAPSWEESAFTVKPGEDAVLQVSLRY